MIKDFSEPSAKYRIKPFWFWNGEITKEIIDYQIEEMSEKGIGGVFICPRQGQSVAYLSKKWFELVDYACEKAKKEGMEAWLYDEYPYPSGMSGGEVLLAHPEAEHKILTHYTFDEEGPVNKQYELPFAKVLYAKAFPVSKDGRIEYDKGIDISDEAGNLQTTQIYQTTGLTKYNRKRFFSAEPHRVFEINLAEGRWKIIVYMEEKLGDFKYFGGFFDPCNKEAVKTFLNTTHEKYYKNVGKNFGNYIKGFFSDEVGLLSPIPWSGEVIDFFEKKNGYSILEHLAAMHDSEYPNAWKIRYDLYRTIHELFVESYHKQVADWCGSKNLYYATEVPSMRMTTQRYSTIVGGDTCHEKLGQSLEWIYDQYIHHYRANAKAVSSLQRQLERDYAMIESFHSVGWSMTLQDAKWMVDRLAASGINLYNFHAFYMTINGITKHDAPPSHFLQNPHWKHYKQLADYVARLSAMVTNTEAIIKVAVLDPVASLWTCISQPFSQFQYSGESQEEKELCDSIRDDWAYICKSLLFEQIDYDHLDTEILAESVIKNGEICIGKGRYSVLIIPPNVCIEHFAVDKIKEFVKQGGKLLSLGRLPDKVIDEDNNPLETWSSFFVDESNDNVKHIEMPDGVRNTNNSEWIGWCRERADLPINIQMSAEAKKNVVSTLRYEADGNYVLFVANQGKEVIDMTLYGNKDNAGKNMIIGKYDIATGEKYDNCMESQIRLLPYESMLLSIAFDKDSCDKYHMSGEEVFKIEIDMNKQLPLTLHGNNIYRLPYWEMSLDRVNWKRVEVKTFVEQCVENNLLTGDNIEFLDSFGVPRKMNIQYPLKAYYRQNFTVDVIPQNIHLLMDKGAVSGNYTMLINGKKVKSANWKKQFVNDHENILLDIGEWINQGVNSIECEIDIEKSENGIRDPLYLYGDFGVYFDENRQARIGAMPTDVTYNSSYIEGIPYYSGEYSLTTTVELNENQILEMDKFKNGVVSLSLGKELYFGFEVIVNGQSLGTRIYAPYIWKCNNKVWKKGKNQVEIKVTNTLSNMMDGTFFDYDKHAVVEI